MTRCTRVRVATSTHDSHSVVTLLVIQRQCALVSMAAGYLRRTFGSAPPRQLGGTDRMAALCPIPRKAAASFAWLFDTHINGRIGSPIVTGSTRWRRFSSSVGSFSISVGPPPPGRRTSPTNVSGAARSFSLRPIVLCAIPVARDVAVIPPYPAVLASAAASRRTARSGPVRPP